MDPERFDAITRGLGTLSSSRRLLGGGVGSGLLALIGTALGDGGVDARRRRNRNKRLP